MMARYTHPDNVSLRNVWQRVCNLQIFYIRRNKKPAVVGYKNRHATHLHSEDRKQSPKTKTLRFENETQRLPITRPKLTCRER